MLGLVGCTTMRPIATVFSSPTRFQVSPPSVALKIPQPGEIVLRESSSPVPAHTCIVSDGAIANSPIDTHFSLSNTGRNVVPALVVFQIPPAAAATKNVREGLGIPTTLDTRPAMLAGPRLRQRNPARSVESRITPVWRVLVEVGEGCGGGAGFCAKTGAATKIRT